MSIQENYKTAEQKLAIKWNRCPLTKHQSPNRRDRENQMENGTEWMLKSEHNQIKSCSFIMS